MKDAEIIARSVAKKFSSFGGGRVCDDNPIAEAMKNDPPAFALGVSIGDVVQHVLAEARKLRRKRRAS